MANEIIGKILEIGKTFSIPTKSGNTFEKRQLILDTSHFDQYTGQKFENYPQFQFLQKNTSVLDSFQQGQLVKVSFALNGRSYAKDGETKWITDVIGYKIEPYQRQQALQSSPANQPPTQQIQAQPSQQNVGNFESNQTSTPPANNRGDDDLPF